MTMPTGYIAWHVEAERRYKKGQRQKRCKHGYWLFSDEKCSAHGKLNLRKR